MDISNSEKLIVTMLSEIHKKLEITDGIDPDFIQAAISSDNEWAIGWKYDDFSGSEEKPAHVKETLRVLGMWEWIETSYDTLSEEEKTHVADQAGVFGTNPKFPGFDGNNECEYLNVLNFLIEKLGRFENFKGRDLNSHAPMMKSYSRMNSVFERERDLLCGEMLSAEQLANVLNERTHPSNR